MAPAIVHFLVGAAILLGIAVPIVLRYDVDREAAIWVIPAGGLWGIAPDFHHIAPVGSEALRSFHSSPWAEVFALHYTLDRPTIRAQYHESIFWSIAIFTAAIAGVWIAGRVHDAEFHPRGRRQRMAVVAAGSLLAGGFATLVAGVLFSIQGLLPAAAKLVGAVGVVAGGLVVILVGVSGGIVWGLAAEVIYVRREASGIVPAAGVGASGGVVAWVGGVVVGVPLGRGLSIPLVHWGSLGGCVAYGVVFAVVYVVVRGAFE